MGDLVAEKNDRYDSSQISNFFGVGKFARGLLLAIALVTVTFKCTLLRSREIENPVDIILDALQTNCAAEWSRKYTSEPHLPGTNFGLAQWTKDKFDEYGWKTEIDTYDVYVSYPEGHDLNLLENGELIYKAPLREDAIPEDSTSAGNDTVPTFLAYGANGNVTAEYVYANYGTRDDFAMLKKLNVDITGKIVVARYGSIFRGLKVKFAQENGAIGLLLYSDPGDDHGITPANGYKQYPHGPARQESSVQRGNVQFAGGVGATPGDPTTPGYASKGLVERKDPHTSIGRIPVLPISYREVKPILEKLNGNGKKAPEAWVGELEGFEYNIGPSPNVTLNLYSNQIYNITPLWNVYAEIEGENKDDVIIIGNHRDAWIKGGAGDPNSGSAALIEIARALGSLKRAGYKFQRTIILQSYDGEEYGLLGSTEFGEYAARRLQKNVIAYLNMDSAAIGRHLRLKASPVLNRVLRKVAKWLPYPGETADSLYDHFLGERGDRILNLGSGSDYTVFLEHLGIPSADISFVQGKGDAIYHYHSNYDSYDWMEKYGDKGFVYHNVAAKYLSLIALDLTKHKVIDFSICDYAKDLVTYYTQLEQEIPKEWYHKPVTNRATREYLSGEEQNEKFISDISEKVFFTKERYVFPELMTPVQCSHSKRVNMLRPESHGNLTFGDVFWHAKKKLEEFVEVASNFDETSEALQAQYNKRHAMAWWLRIKLHFQVLHQNMLLKYFERNFLYTGGLHERSWFKHIVFASGRFTGYAGQTWPGIREAIEDDDIDRAVKWVGLAAKAVKRVAVQMR
ncbi:Zn-dependent exopeptidase [Metschnikowia bicuspidata var. bicuspidata NRRL YB-4993]|uniref:Zn-dependent exopeptidase n=1 Tax=Metschnikowia bicuspidata var. bicuspidata NRRL YB-4993 TaxID=869754 RepID=A0A1A0HAI4_9ASCO|nr:Zn-dependent exopeptidase [Metschnikowia bicuspidata var. bicuspidata NRRL YB-4993]OBA20888.1 Zn-dependent exopeptidase [Metschnikowia bicuspidata var. bicuspidata NRRL YB-4993]